MITISVYSDYKCGALSESDYKWLSARENRKERYIDEWERLELGYEADDELELDFESEDGDEYFSDNCENHRYND